MLSLKNYIRNLSTQLQQQLLLLPWNVLTLRTLSNVPSDHTDSPDQVHVVKGPKDTHCTTGCDYDRLCSEVKRTSAASIVDHEVAGSVLEVFGTIIKL